MSPPGRKVRFYTSVATFLEEIVSSISHDDNGDFHDDDDDSPSILVIICSTRDQFLEQLFIAVNNNDNNDNNDNGKDLLTRPIGLIAISSTVKLIFCPTVESFRAYISSSRLRQALSSQCQQKKNQKEKQKEKKNQNDQQRPTLMILDPLGLHYLTPEFSAQGLSRTFASLVEAAARVGAELILSESLDAVAFHGGGLSRHALWYADVPLLSGSDAQGLGGDNNIGRGYGVPVKWIVQRWFDLDGGM